MREILKIAQEKHCENELREIVRGGRQWSRVASRNTLKKMKEIQKKKSEKYCKLNERNTENSSREILGKLIEGNSERGP